MLREKRVKFWGRRVRRSGRDFKWSYSLKRGEVKKEWSGTARRGEAGADASDETGSAYGKEQLQLSDREQQEVMLVEGGGILGEEQRGEKELSEVR